MKRDLLPLETDTGQHTEISGRTQLAAQQEHPSYFSPRPEYGRAHFLSDSFLI